MRDRYDRSLKAELYEDSTKQWIMIEDFPYSGTEVKLELFDVFLVFGTFDMISTTSFTAET